MLITFPMDPTYSDYPDLRQKMGVYKVCNKVNGNAYVGSAIDLRNRFYNHVWHLEKGTHRSPKLQHAWRKYGRNNFEFSVLEYVLEPEQLIARSNSGFTSSIPIRMAIT